MPPSVLLKYGFSLRNLKAITCTANWFQVAGVFRIILYFLSNPADIDVDGARGDETGITPHGVQPLVTSEHTARMGRKLLQQAKLSRGGPHLTASDRQNHGSSIDHEIPDLHHIFSQGSLETPQDRLDTRNQLARTKRLCNVIVTT